MKRLIHHAGRLHGRALCRQSAGDRSGRRGLAAKSMQGIARALGSPEQSSPAAGQPSGAHSEDNIFTPAAESPFAGHPTVSLRGAAWLLNSPTEAKSLILEEEIGLVHCQVEPGGNVSHMRDLKYGSATPASTGKRTSRRSALAPASRLTTLCDALWSGEMVRRLRHVHDWSQWIGRPRHKALPAFRTGKRCSGQSGPRAVYLFLPARTYRYKLSARACSRPCSAS